MNLQNKILLNNKDIINLIIKRCEKAKDPILQAQFSPKLDLSPENLAQTLPIQQAGFLTQLPGSKIVPTQENFAN